MNAPDSDAAFQPKGACVCWHPGLGPAQDFPLDRVHECVIARRIGLKYNTRMDIQPKEDDWFGHVYAVLVQTLETAAIAYVCATLTLWTWIAWRLHDVPVPSVENHQGNQLVFAAEVIFNTVFLLATLLSLWPRIRQPTLTAAVSTQKRRHTSQRRWADWCWRLTALMVRLVLALAIGMACAEWVSSAYVRWYAYDIGVPLHELSEDYGMAFDSVLLRFKVLLVVMFLVLWKSRTKHRSVPSP